MTPFLPRAQYIEKYSFVDDCDGVESTAGYLARFELQHTLRERFREQWGYVVPTREVMNALVRLLTTVGVVRVLDAGSGSGYLSKELNANGVKSFAVDCCDYADKARTSGFPIQVVHQRDACGDAVPHVTKGFDAVLLVWPPYEQPFASQILDAMLPGQWLIYEGEYQGCCATDDFFNQLEDSSVWHRRDDLANYLNEVHLQFASLHDHWYVFQRRKK